MNKKRKQKQSKYEIKERSVTNWLMGQFECGRMKDVSLFSSTVGRRASAMHTRGSRNQCMDCEKKKKNLSEARQHGVLVNVNNQSLKQTVLHLKHFTLCRGKCTPL